MPIQPRRLLRIAEVLRSADVFTPSFAAPEIDLYEPMVYRQQRERFETHTRLLVDRNVLSRWVSMVRGEASSANDRLAAGILAFAQCADIEIEPNIPLYEVAQWQGNDGANAELADFRFADTVHPGYWAEVALGEGNQVPLSVEAPSAGPDIDFTMPLRRWVRNYILCLKIADLELQGGSAVRRLLAFIDWMHREFLIGGPAFALAAIYLAPNAPRRALFKGIRSAARRDALAGIRNAAWDVTLVSQMLNAVQEQDEKGRLTLLGSLDRSVHRLARGVLDISDAAETDEDAIRRSLAQYWNARDSATIVAEFVSVRRRSDDPSRQLNKPAPLSFLTDLTTSLERCVLEWMP